jgi:hypothetical protein
MLMEMAVKSLETAVEAMESMEMAPGALPRPGRVLEQRSLSPKIGLRWRRRCRTLLGKTLIDLGFRLRRALYRWRGGVIGQPGPTHHRLARPRGHPCYQVVWWPHGPPLTLLRTSSRVGKNRNFGFCFVQFQEYFLCSFSDTQKQQKTGNWHCGISLIG